MLSFPRYEKMFVGVPDMAPEKMLVGVLLFSDLAPEKMVLGVLLLPDLAPGLKQEYGLETLLGV